MSACAVYILLTRTDTLFSRIIHLLSGDQFTHAAIGVNGVTGSFYGFGRRWPNLLFPGAFRRECPWKFKHSTPCRIYSIQVSPECYSKVSAILQSMEWQQARYHYGLLGVVLCRLPIDTPKVRIHHFFCSEFVAYVLEKTGAVTLPVKSTKFRPAYFCDLPEAVLEYEGDPICPEVLHGE